MNAQARAQVDEVVSFASTILVMGFMIGMVKQVSPRLLASPETRDMLARRRWQEISRYLHDVDDITNIAYREGTVKLYHGTPTEFAEIFVKEGPHVPYKVEDTARYVAGVYGLPWMEFRPWAYRIHEVVERVSTATAPVACRWAWSFPLGEVLTDLNSHARMFVASKQLAREKGYTLDDAYDELSNKAAEEAKRKGLTYNIETAPDILGYPDKLALEAKTGALVEVEVDARAISEHAAKFAQQYLRSWEKGEWTVDVLTLYWNHQYRDIKVAPGNIKSARIVIRDMQPWEQDMIEDKIREGLETLATG